jgi:hypothetical protein
MNIETIISKIKNALGEGVDKVSDEVEKSQVFEKFEDSDDKVAKILDDAGKALTSLFDTIADKAEPMIKKTKAKIYEGIFDEYRKDGSPYGETHEGFMQWVDEHETEIREKVDDGITKTRETILSGVKKTQEYINREVTKKEKPSDAVVDRSSVNDQKSSEEN